MEKPYQHKTKGTEDHLMLTDEVLGEMISGMAEEKFIAMGKFKDGTMDEAKLAETLTEIQGRQTKLLSRARIASGQTGFDHLVANGYFASRKADAIDAYNKVFHPFSQMMKSAALLESTGANPKGPVGDTMIGGKELVRVWNAAGIITTSDAQSEENYTDLMVHYVEKPITFLNVIPKRSIDQMDIREFREDSTKVEGDVASRAEGAALAQVDFGTKRVTRDLTSVGAHFTYNLELENDSNRSHFMPYANARLLEKHNLEIEDASLNGDGSGNNVTGVRNETGAVAAGAIATGAWTVTKVNQIKDMIKTVLTNAYRTPTHIVVHPSLYYDLLALGTDAEGWFLSAPVSVNAPLGASIPTLFGVPIVMSWALSTDQFVVMNMENTLLYTNGAMVNRQQGTINDQLIKLQRTIIIYCWCQQFSRFGNWIVKGTKTD